MRIVFMGSPEFSVPVLEALLASEHEIIAVYSQPPRKAGRGKAERPTPVHKRALEAGIEVRTPLNFKADEDVAAFRALNADLAVVIAYGLILPQTVLDAPRLGCVNLHASLLPRWRGAAPLHRAIMAGDHKTGVCLMKMEAGLDTGPVYASKEVAITPDMTTGELHDILASLSAEILMENIDKLDQITPKSQAEEGVLYAEKINKDETEINWSLRAAEVQRHIHGLAPFPGGWSLMDGERIKFHKVEIANMKGEAGKILDNQMVIACGEGAIRPLILQREGKRAMPIDEALRGMGKVEGKVLG